MFTVCHCLLYPSLQEYSKKVRALNYFGTWSKWGYRSLGTKYTCTLAFERGWATFVRKECVQLSFQNPTKWTPRWLSVSAPAPECQGCISVLGLWRRLGELWDRERHEHKSAEHSWQPAHHCGYSCSLPSVGNEHGVVGGAVKDETVFQFLKLGKKHG